MNISNHASTPNPHCQPDGDGHRDRSAELAFVVTNECGRDTLTGSKWQLPRGARAGTWMRRKEGAVIRSSELSGALAMTPRGARIFVAEVKGNRAHRNDVRLTEEITPYWHALDTASIVRACLVSEWRKCHGDSPASPEWADLTGAPLKFAQLVSIDLSHVALASSDLQNANLSQAHVAGANLSGANLRGANLSRANFTGTRFFRSDLSNTNLFRARLTNAHLIGANLLGAHVGWADFSGADLSGAHITEEQAERMSLSGEQRAQVRIAASAVQRMSPAV